MHLLRGLAAMYRILAGHACGAVLETVSRHCGSMMKKRKKRFVNMKKTKVVFFQHVVVWHGTRSDSP
jgi:hypothetical protein